MRRSAALPSVEFAITKREEREIQLKSRLCPTGRFVSLQHYRRQQQNCCLFALASFFRQSNPPPPLFGSSSGAFPGRAFQGDFRAGL